MEFLSAPVYQLFSNNFFVKLLFVIFSRKIGKYFVKKYCKDGQKRSKICLELSKIWLKKDRKFGQKRSKICLKNI